MTDEGEDGHLFVRLMRLFTANVETALKKLLSETDPRGT